MADCVKEYQDAANTVTDCPNPTDKILFVDTNGLAVFRAWSTIKNCLAIDFFGSGAIYITGDDLDIDNKYYNTSLPNNLTLFYNGLPKFMIPNTEWTYILDVDNNVEGIEILTGITYGSDDIFVIIPAPKSD